MPLSEVRGASPKKERGGKKDSARGGKKKKAAFDLAAVVRQATEEEKGRQSADEESFGAGALGSSDDECKPCLPSSASSDALARKQKTRSRWRFGAKISGTPRILAQFCAILCNSVRNPLTLHPSSQVSTTARARAAAGAARPRRC